MALIDLTLDHKFLESLAALIELPSLHIFEISLKGVKLIIFSEV